MVEKRKSPRFSLSVEVRWKRAASSDEASPSERTHSKNLSSQGLRMTLPSGVPVGETLRLEIELPGYYTLYTLGRIAWATTGVQIKGWAIALSEGGIELELSDSEKIALDRYIAGSLA